MGKIEGIAAVWLPVSDMSRAVGFYTEKLGLELRRQQDDWSELEQDGTTIGLNRRESPAGDGGAVVAFRVDEIESVVEELKGEGVDFAGGISEHPWGKIAPFKDLDGNDLQLIELPA